MKQDCWLPLLHDVLKKHDWKAKSKQNKKHRNTAVGGLHTCGSRSLNSTRKYLKIKHERPVRSIEFFTHTHAMKGTKPLCQPPIVSRSTSSNRSAGKRVGWGKSFNFKWGWRVKCGRRVKRGSSG